MATVVTTQTLDKAFVVTVSKRALDALTVTALRDDVNTSLAGVTAGLPVVIDLSKVEFAPSVALGTLVNLAQDLKWSGRRMLLCGLTRQVRGTIAVTRLDKVFEVHLTLADALAALGATK
jgi:anti-sigma B factor antagonist